MVGAVSTEKNPLNLLWEKLRFKGVEGRAIKTIISGLNSDDTITALLPQNIADELANLYPDKKSKRKKNQPFAVKKLNGPENGKILVIIEKLFN